jgi:hypothetical protein
MLSAEESQPLNIGSLNFFTFKAAWQLFLYVSNYLFLFPISWGADRGAIFVLFHSKAEFGHREMPLTRTKKSSSLVYFAPGNRGS